MTEKRFYCDNLLDVRGYAIFDLNDVDKVIFDFVDSDGDVASWMFDNYLVDETDSIMTGEEVMNKLNEQTIFSDENYALQLLKRTIDELKYFTGLFKEDEVDITVRTLMRDVDLFLGAVEDNVTGYIGRLIEENELLKSELHDVGSTLEEQIVKLQNENEQLKRRLDELKTYDKEEFAEAEHINDIYKEKGFCGVIAYAKDKLQHYGVVKEVEKGLWVMITGGWSDNEFWLSCLNNPISMFGMKHYRGYLRGGAFYYTEKPRGNVEIILKGDVE